MNRFRAEGKGARPLKSVMAGRQSWPSKNTIFAVTARRYPIVDEEAGAVLGLVLFERKPGVAMRRNLLSEWFFIEQGKIRAIYASMFYPEQEAMAPNWPPFYGNWPIAPPPK